RGVGRALMEYALTRLDRLGVPTVRLDATPLGQPLYEQLGFVTEYVLTRFEGPAPSVEAAGGGRPARPAHLEGLVRVDCAGAGPGRGKILRRLFAEYPGEARVVERQGRVEGYLMARPGARALYVGPCVARAGAGPLLLADAWRRHAGEEVFLDIPDGN